MFNLIEKTYLNLISQQKLDQLDQKILNFYMSQQGQKIEQLIQVSFNEQLQNYIKKYPQFFNVILMFDLDTQNLQNPQYQEYYAQLINPGEENPIILINVYQLFSYIYFKKNLKDLLTWHHKIHFTLAHQLAHILDFKQRNYNDISSTIEAHDQNFDKCFYKLTNKHIYQIQDEI